MAIHWTKKLKEENKKLKEDIRKIIKGDFETTITYSVMFKMEEAHEKMIWLGDTIK